MFISHANKVMFKIFQARLQQYVSQEFPDVQAGFIKKQRSQRSYSQHSLDLWIKQGIPEKHLFFLHNYSKAFDCADHNKLEKRDLHTSPPYLSPEKICRHVKKQPLGLDMKQWTGSKLGSKYDNVTYCHSCLTYMESTSCKCQVG